MFWDSAVHVSSMGKLDFLSCQHLNLPSEPFTLRYFLQWFICGWGAPDVDLLACRSATNWPGLWPWLGILGFLQWMPWLFSLDQFSLMHAFPTFQLLHLLQDKRGGDSRDWDHTSLAKQDVVCGHYTFLDCSLFQINKTWYHRVRSCILLYGHWLWLLCCWSPRSEGWGISET